MEAVSAMKWEMAIKEDLESHSTQSLPVIQGQASFTSCMENGKSHQLLCHDRKTDIFKISTKLGNFFCLKSFNDFTFQSWHVRPYSSTPAPYHPNLTCFHFYHKLSAHWPFHCFNCPSLYLSPTLFPRTIMLLLSLLGELLGSCSTMNKMHTCTQHTKYSHL